jgi:cytoskeletal protein CcmA (bactofilin family)
MSTLQRLRYLEGAFLRDVDFRAEQDYFVQLQRGSHLATHLPGIAEGLLVTSREKDGGVVEPAIGKVAHVLVIAPGYAFDELGRRLCVPAELAFDETFVAAQGLDGETGQYGVYLQYARDPGGRPPAGYELCDDDQQTRWSEGVTVKLGKNLACINPPAAHEPLSDDPARLCPVLLGRVELEQGYIVGASMPIDDRRYSGVLAGRLKAPADPAAHERIEVESRVEAREPIHAHDELHVKGDLATYGSTVWFRESGNWPPDPANAGGPAVRLDRMGEDLVVSIGDSATANGRLSIGFGEPGAGGEQRLHMHPNGVLELLPTESAVQFGVAADPDRRLKLRAAGADLAIELGTDPSIAQSLLIGSKGGLDPAGAGVVVSGRGDVEVRRTLRVVEATTLEGALEVNDEVVVDGKLAVGGDAALAGKLTVQGNVEARADVAVTGDVQIGGATSGASLDYATGTFAGQVQADRIRTHGGAAMRMSSGVINLPGVGGTAMISHGLDTVQVVIWFTSHGAAPNVFPQAPHGTDWELALHVLGLTPGSVQFHVHAVGSGWLATMARWWAVAAV